MKIRSEMFANTENFKKEYLQRLIEKYGHGVERSHPTERYDILGLMVRDYANFEWRNTRETIRTNEKKQLIYFSMEFLIGRLLVNNMQNLGIYQIAKDGLNELGLNIHDLEEQEPDAGLGNGGLGRLAACFIDSMASLGLPGHGNTIRYEYGFFKQKIEKGAQVEIPDQWLVNGNVWEVRKPKHAVEVKFYGHAETYPKADGTYGIRTVDATHVRAVPYDMTVVGFKNGVANNLRLWSAEPSEENLPTNLSFEQYLGTLKELCHGLYPDDTTEHGKMLRLRQQYFLVSAGLQSAVRAHYRRYKTLDNFKDKYVFQLNDTHPILAIPEIMRIMMDEYNMSWDSAWDQVTSIMAYTNHTVMVEALEKWPVRYVQKLTPRCYMIIEEIHRRSRLFFNERAISENAKNNMAIIKDGMIHMTNLALYTVFSVNGVAALHTEILKHQTFRDYYNLFPEKFNNKTNGVTHRRWLLYANPELASLITEKIGDGWTYDMRKISEFEKYADDADVHQRLFEIKLANKQRLADYVKVHNNLDIDPNSIFDTQVKRLHAYKRQLMNVFRIMYVYREIKTNPDFRPFPKTYIFGAKAAPTYYFAKQVIELINGVAEVVNNDEDVNKYIKIVFIENYSVSNAEIIIPATDISEQISTAGKEASGTGNMKFMMNGALTLGTLDGANVEIHDFVGDDHSFIFGLKEDEVLAKKEAGYNPWDVYHRDNDVKMLIDSLIDGTWSNGDKDKFRSIFDEIMYRGDEFLVLEDLQAYVDETRKIDKHYLDKSAWAKSVVINIARSGFFTTDRTIAQYNKDIWHLETVSEDE